MRETTPRIQRIYLRIEQAGGGMVKFAASLIPPSYDEPMLVLLSRGAMPMGQPLSLLLVSDPTQSAALRGKEGASAYQVAQAEGFAGSPATWLASLIGAAGLSAYDIARELGYGGTKTQWLASLKGAPASAYLGTVTVGQTATVAIAAGVRRVMVPVPASFGLAVGDALQICPLQAVAGYAIHDAVTVSATSISIGVNGPLLAIGAAMPPISCKLFRLNI